MTASHRTSHRVTDMILVPGGTYLMGSERFYPEERPVHPVAVGPLLFDRFPVTNREFSEFVEETGYLTQAESQDPEVGGSLVARMAGTGSPSGTERWDYVPTANWRHPLGEASSVNHRLADHPVVHISYSDALAYAQWCGKDLPTEEEWEHASRGGLVNCEYAWGDELAPDGAILANFRHGSKPLPSNSVSTTPVGSYPPSGLGLHDMIGNVWEWTQSLYSVSHLPAGPYGDCCGTARTGNPDSLLHCIKGGSFLCSPTYCRRYRPAARQGVDMITTTNHLGFRCVQRTFP